MATHLPKSPSMCRKVAKELATVHGIPIQNAPNNKKQIHCLSPHTDKAVIALYVWDDILWQALGLKDSVIVKDYVTGKKCKMQKRHLIMTLKEVHAVYSEEFLNRSVKLTKLCFTTKICVHYPMQAFVLIMKMWSYYCR
jgi:hypothetical protein